MRLAVSRRSGSGRRPLQKVDRPRRYARLALPSDPLVYLEPRIEAREGLLRVARYSARTPVAESRLRYDVERAEVELVADRTDGPYAGVHRMTALEGDVSLEAPGEACVHAGDGSEVEGLALRPVHGVPSGVIPARRRVITNTTTTRMDSGGRRARRGLMSSDSES